MLNKNKQRLVTRAVVASAGVLCAGLLALSLPTEASAKCRQSQTCASVYRDPDYAPTVYDHTYNCSGVNFTLTGTTEGYYACCPQVGANAPRKVWCKSQPSDPTDILAGIPD